MSASRFVLGLVFTLFAAGAMAQERPPYGQEIGIDLAKKIAAGAAAESKKNGWRMAIAVVDNHGFLVYYERMDDTQTASVQIALDKAKTAAMLRRPTKALEDAIVKGRVVHVHAPDVGRARQQVVDRLSRPGVEPRHLVGDHRAGPRLLVLVDHDVVG